MKMLKEERSLRHWALSSWMGPENKKQFRKDVSAFRRAVIEDVCKQVADKYGEPNDDVGSMDTMARIIAAAIRRM